MQPSGWLNLTEWTNLWRQTWSNCWRARRCLGCVRHLAVCGLLAVTLASATPVRAQSTHSPVTEGEIYHVLSRRNELSLTERFSRVIELEARITRVDGFDPDLLSVTALTPHRVRVQALTAGVTTLVLVDEFDKSYTIEVFVEGDVRYLQSYINRFFPDSSVSAVKVRESVVLRGVVADPSHISQITEVAEQFFPRVINHMQFGAANQVRLQVRIMEAQRSRIRQLGFNWSLLSNSGYVSSNPGGLAAPSGSTLIPGGFPGLEHGAGALSDSSISFGLVNSNTVFRGFLDALKKEGLLRILVETSVVADSGRPASLLSGGEFPILVPQALGTLSVEWREFGVKLEAVPIVLGHGQVILEIAPEFSERDFANATTLNNTTVPAITTRRANTQVRMKFGQTLMIGGLIATRYTAETNKVPILGELPGIGAAFRRVKYDENETELIILVTPEYVAPLDSHQVPDGGPGQFTDVPTDRELYWQGLIEVPNYGGPTPPGHGPAHDWEIHTEHDPGQPLPPGIPHMPQPPMRQGAPYAPPQELEQGPMPYIPAEPVPTEPPGLRGPADADNKQEESVPLVTPEKPAFSDPAESEPRNSPRLDNGNQEASSTPLLPVMPPPSRQLTVDPISHSASAGHWQQSAGRVAYQPGDHRNAPAQSAHAHPHSPGTERGSSTGWTAVQPVQHQSPSMNNTTAVRQAVGTRPSAASHSPANTALQAGDSPEEPPALIGPDSSRAETSRKASAPIP